MLDIASGATPRLTQLAHGGGCGCKLAPAVLRQLLGSQPALAAFPQLLVGNETADDAAVWQEADGRCIVATTDFFMPLVDDPRDFGRIAAANAISDIYAMGARPVLALAILGLPLGRLPLDIAGRILAGGAEICADAGIPVAGGHSIDTPEPIYGLVVIGTCRAGQVRRNAGARIGDRLILTKPLGVGIYANALRRGALDAAGYAALIGTTTVLNRIGAELGEVDAVHAMTDVTGFGLLGHALEMARGAGVTLRIDPAALPLLPAARALADAGFVTGGSQRNWAGCAAEMDLPPALPETLRHLMTDPQTSGGLLIACAPEAAAALLARIRAAGHGAAAVIGAAEAGPPRLRLA